MNLLKTALITLLAAAAPTLAAADPGQPIVTFKTTLFDDHGTQNAFHFMMGATEKSYFDIDFGFGPLEVEVGVANFTSTGEEEEGIGMTGTTITGSVSEEGIVRIYGDPSKIDYLDLEGLYITQLDMSRLTNVEILNLKHNQLESLDLTPQSKLMALYINDNPFNVTPLVIGTPKPQLQILEMNIVGALDPAFDLADYPSMLSFDAYATHSLTKCDPTNCPDLLKLSIDVTNVSSVDVRNNPKLLILNVSDTKVTSLDLSGNPTLTELYCSHSGSYNKTYKINSLDLSNNPKLTRLYCGGNALTDLDVSSLPSLVSFSCNRNNLPGIDFSENPSLYSVDISNNRMDFSTMPLPRETFNEYYYYQQQMPVERSYPVNGNVDFRYRVLRVDGQTWCALFACQKDEDGQPVNVELDESYYTYENGKVTFLKESADSLYLAFANELFPEYDIRTQCFMVKSPEDYGKDNPAVIFNAVPGQTLTFGVGLRGASADGEKTFSVDFGDGTPVTFTAASATTPGTNAVGTVKDSGMIVVYIPEGEDLTALTIDSMEISGLDVTAAHSLQNLAVTNCGLKEIDLRWNRCLTDLDLSGNLLKELYMEGVDGTYGKTVIQTVKASDNLLTSFGPYATYAHTIDLSNNALQQFNLQNANTLRSLNLSNNRLAELDLSDCEDLAVLNVAGNSLKALDVPNTISLTQLNIEGNCIPLSAMPVNAAAVYTYAPQQPWHLPAKGPTANLTKQLLNYQGKSTSFVWHNAADGSVVDPKLISETEQGGIFKFAGEETGTVYCTMTHPLFPDFATETYRTTDITAADVPTHVVCTFTTLQSLDNASITLTAAEPYTTVYIDWTGNGDLEEYVLETSYIPFEVKTQAGASCSVYSYDENDGVSVFSINAGKLGNIDASGMNSLTTFSVYGAQLSADDIKLPVNSQVKEIALNGSKLTSLDIFLPFAKTLDMLNVTDNELTELDLTPFAGLGTFYAANNAIESAKLSNPMLWECSLAGNKLTEIDFTGVPKLSQIALFDNYLTSIDLTPLERVVILDISTNCFDFTTLPSGNGIIVYYYGNQRPIAANVTDDAQVDLSGYGAEAFRWFIGTPSLDEEGNLVGEELIEGEEFTLENGVTTFKRNFHHIMCVMTNAAYPSLYLVTDFIDVTNAAGIDNTGDAGKLRADTDGNSITASAPCTLYDIAGHTLGQGTHFGPLPSGIYILKSAAGTLKVSL